MSTINCKGIFTPGGEETRDLLLLDVEHNGNQYDWQIYIPPGTDISQFIIDNTARILKQIDDKEAIWNALEPKTRTIEGPLHMMDQQTVPIQKEEIVKPDIPDYYAMRRKEYPSIGDQIGAIINPNASPSLSEIAQMIQDVKNKYPKT
jgi:hypothetical protein